jgi:hypothetical protein
MNLNSVNFNQVKLSEMKTSKTNLNQMKSKQVKIKHQKHLKTEKTRLTLKVKQIRTSFVIKLTTKLNSNNHVFLMNLKYMLIDDFMLNSVNLNHLTNTYISSSSEISAEYQNLMKIFFKVNTDKLSSH